jgi:hypothetical protein
MRLVALAVWLICMSTTVAFAQTPRPTPKKTPAVPAQQPPGLTERVQELERSVKTLEIRLGSIRSLPSSIATLDCATKKFGTVAPSELSLVFFVACEEIASDLEGHKLHLLLGNPHSVAFTQISGNLYYGKDWSEAFNKKVEVPIINRLAPGTWQKVVVIVNPSKTDEMRTLLLELNMSTVSAPTRP